MSYAVRIILVLLVVGLLAGLVVMLIARSRVRSDGVRCQDHLRDLGLIGVRHPSIPGAEIPPKLRDELPPGTIVLPELAPDRRCSWYAYTLGALDAGIDGSRPAGGALGGLLAGFQSDAPWDAEVHADLARYRLTTALCPAQVPQRDASQPSPANYIALGGLGIETPGLDLDTAGVRAGAYRYDSPTPNRMFADGLQMTAQIMETNRETGPWLQGGPSTLRGLDVDNLPYTGAGRPFGGCHPGGVYASMADGSVRFIMDSMDPPLFRALMTLAGGSAESDAEIP